MWEKITELISSLQPETIKDTIVAIFSCAGGLIVALMGDHLYLLQWLCYFVAADWLTGFYAAKRTKTYASAVGHAGIAKKLLIIFVAIGFHGVDQILDMPFIGVWAVGALAINELISILENIEKAGLGSVIPSRVRVLLDSVQQQQDKKVKEKLCVNEPNIKGENPK